MYDHNAPFGSVNFELGKLFDKVRKDIEDTYGVRISRWQASRVKKNALSACTKGLLSNIANLLPDAEHRLCVRHIFTNWIKVVKGVTCNNMAETFNSWILEARKKPILTMLEEIRRKAMCWMVEKKTQAAKCRSIITPRVQATINDHMQATRNWKAIEASENVYWDINGIPCEHATTAICSKNENPEIYVASLYSKEACYETSYALSLKPLYGQSIWQQDDGGEILPSDPRIKYGRPSNKRKKSKYIQNSER
ncbi:uncharacterized protein LOC141613257 [Silene latifolia]|uniref:uncharacterized protein LOC141613257 n=1 Tax=Silene latifolia TaxID=37657 RepID=UPI003D781860